MSFQPRSKAGKQGSISQISRQRVPDTRGQECKWAQSENVEIGFQDFEMLNFHENIAEGTTQLTGTSTRSSFVHPFCLLCMWYSMVSFMGCVSVISSCCAGKAGCRNKLLTTWWPVAMSRRHASLACDLSWLRACLQLWLICLVPHLDADWTASRNVCYVSPKHMHLDNLLLTKVVGSLRHFCAVQGQVHRTPSWKSILLLWFRSSSNITHGWLFIFIEWKKLWENFFVKSNWSKTGKSSAGDCCYS